MIYLRDAILILSCFALVFGPPLFIVWRLDRRDHRLQREAVDTVHAASAAEIATWSADHRTVLADRLTRIRHSCLEEVETADASHLAAAENRLREVEAAEQKLLDTDHAAAA